MANCGTTPVKFLLRKDTLATWSASTVILAKGEPSVVTDTGQMKIGDGVNTWLNLPYVGTGASIIFDGGGPYQTYSAGPVLDCGSIF
jgi:Major tropism determinant N-terminal domain